MNSPEVKAFIKKHSSLFWYIPEDKKKDISLDVLVEFILNYGDIYAVKELISKCGINTVADHFFKSVNMSERRKGNYFELTLNYFTFLFNKYAHRDTDTKTE
jgi:hypothetical protein